MVLLRSIYATTATVLLGAQSVAAAPVAAAAAAPDLGSDISSGFQKAGDDIKGIFERCVPDDPTSCGSGNVKREAGISDLGQDIKGGFEDVGEMFKDAFTKREPEAGIASDIKSGFEDVGEKFKDAFSKRCVVDDSTPCEGEIS